MIKLSANILCGALVAITVFAADGVSPVSLDRDKIGGLGLTPIVVWRRLLRREHLVA